MRWLRLCLFLTGRIDRKDWWLGSLLLLAFASTLIAALSFADAGPDGPTWDDVDYWTQVVSAALAYPSLALSVKRLHDLGRTGWWAACPAALMLLAQASKDHTVSLFLGTGYLISGLVITALLAFAKGQADLNRFGPPPRRSGVASSGVVTA